MKRSDLKELIKKSMLEVAPKKDSGAMTPEEEKMVADYEEEEANKYALDKEEPMEEAMVTPDNRVEFLANALGHVWNMGTGKNKIDLHSMAQSLVDDMFDQESMQENVLREADDIVAAYAEKKTQKEADLSQANFSDLNQVVRNIAHVNEVGMEEAAMQAIEYIAEQFDVPVDFRDFN